MKNKITHEHVIEQVPPDYYQKGIRTNYLQRIWHTGKLQAVIKEIDFYPNKILDVGCASGWFLSQLMKKYPKSKCFGIDIYTNSIEYGKKHYKKIKFDVADAHRIPYSAKSFDLIICTEVLEHVDDPGKVLLEIRRLLTKKGKAVIELDSGSILFSAVWYLWRFTKGRVWNHSHLHSFTTKKLRRLITKSGMKIISEKKCNLGMAMVFSVQKR